jgi:hypothetical protein
MATRKKSKSEKEAIQAIKNQHANYKWLKEMFARQDELAARLEKLEERIEKLESI